MQPLEIVPVQRPLSGRVRPPGSKSITNRALILAALAAGRSRLRGVLESVDTRVMIESLRKLGIPIEVDSASRTLEIEGSGKGFPATQADLYCENSGTSIRFLTALCATGRGTFRLDGNERMRQRPIAPLVDALAGVGVEIQCAGDGGCPPVQMRASGLHGGQMQVAGSLSSQYLSGLLMVAPAASAPTTIEVTGELVSRPYVEMTLRMMSDFGARTVEPRPNHFRVEAESYRGRTYDIEPDASAASYFFAAAAITGGTVTVEGLNRDALQGDVRFAEVLEKMGCEVEWGAHEITVTGAPLTGIDVDMNDISDTAQTLACVAPFATGATRIRNVAHMRLKETDRVSAVVTELRRTGLEVEEHDDGMTIHPGSILPATIKTYDDHRMAMSFSLLGLRAPGIQIADPGCTAKTYPNYFQDLEMLCRGSR